MTHYAAALLAEAARKGMIKSAKELGVDRETWVKAGGDPLDGSGASLGINLGKPKELRAYQESIVARVDREAKRSVSYRALSAGTQPLTPPESTPGVNTQESTPESTPGVNTQESTPESTPRSVAREMVKASGIKFGGKKPPAMTPAELAMFGEGLYGAEWIRPLARKMLVDPGLVSRWAKGERPIPIARAHFIRGLPRAIKSKKDETP